MSSVTIRQGSCAVTAPRKLHHVGVVRRLAHRELGAQLAHRDLVRQVHLLEDLDRHLGAPPAPVHDLPERPLADLLLPVHHEVLRDDLPVQAHVQQADEAVDAEGGDEVGLAKVDEAPRPRVEDLPPRVLHAPRDLHVPVLDAVLEGHAVEAVDAVDGGALLQQPVRHGVVALRGRQVQRRALVVVAHGGVADRDPLRLTERLEGLHVPSPAEEEHVGVQPAQPELLLDLLHAEHPELVLVVRHGGGVPRGRKLPLDLRRG